MIVAQTTPVAAALQRESHTIPIVFTQASDPIGSGLVASLARPGGNITGFLLYEDGIVGKCLAMLKEIAPPLEHVALMADKETTPFDYFVRSAKAVAPSLAIEVTPTPRKTVRVGLVIVRNIDPAIVTEIEGLVAQLGDSSWEKREAAHKTLTQLGLAAKPKLEAMLKTAKDPEIVYRVERLIAALSRDPTGGTVPQAAP